MAVIPAGPWPEAALQELLDVRSVQPHPAGPIGGGFACQICSMDSTSMTSISILSRVCWDSAKDPDLEFSSVTDAQSKPAAARPAISPPSE